MEAEAALSTYRFSVEEFNRLGQAGIFGEDDRVELIDGEIIVMSPIESKHAGTVTQVSWILDQKLGERVLLHLQNPAVLDDFSEPLPDIAVLKRRIDFYKNGHPGPDDILLLIEVSDTTLAYDRGPKLQKYAERGIAEVLIANLRDDLIEQFREPHSHGYGASRQFGRGAVITAEAFPGVSFAVDELIG